MAGKKKSRMELGIYVGLGGGLFERNQRQWSSEFHDLLDKIRGEPTVEEHYKSLSNLIHDFSNCASVYGRIIIEELHLKNEEKTIKLLENQKGIARGGEKFLVHSIIFKFAHEINYLYKTEDDAGKVGAHELNSCGILAAFGALIPPRRTESDKVLYPPLMSLFDFRGLRLVAVSALPLPKETLVYGSDDGAEPRARMQQRSGAHRKAVTPQDAYLQQLRHLLWRGRGGPFKFRRQVHGQTTSVRGRLGSYVSPREAPKWAIDNYLSSQEQLQQQQQHDGEDDDPTLKVSSPLAIRNNSQYVTADNPRPTRLPEATFERCFFIVW